MKVWKLSGRLLTATGVIHTVFAITTRWNVYTGMAQDKLINSIADDYERASAFWLLIVGMLVILLGETMHYYIRKEQKPAPSFTGYILFILSVFGCIVEPVSGFWLFIPQALIILFANKNSKAF